MDNCGNCYPLAINAVNNPVTVRKDLSKIPVGKFGHNSANKRKAGKLTSGTDYLSDDRAGI